MSSSSDDELDDELMDLGGGGEATESTGSKKRSLDSSDSEGSIALSSDEDDSEDDAPAPPKKKTKKAKPAPKKKAKPAPKKKAKPKPKKKIALPEDSGSSSEDEDAFDPADDGFDDDFYGDADDRAKLQAMNEMEREVILAERREARERAVERAAMRRRLNQEKKAKKREAASAALPRQQSTRTQKLQRGKSASKQQTAIDDLKKRRAQSRKGVESEEESEAELEDSASDDDVDSEADSEEEDRRRRRQRDSDSESDDGETRRFDEDDEEEKPQTPIEFEDFQRIVVGRNSLEKMVHEPYMKDAMTGMFVRVSVGQHEQTGTVTYRVCEVRDVVDGTKRYTLGKTKTVLRLLLKFGRSERLFCMDVVSSKPPTHEEFLRWQHAMDKDGETILSKENCYELGKKYRKAKTQAYTEEMILSRQRRLEQAGQNVQDTSLKFKLESQLQVAQEAGKEEEVAQIQDKIAAVNEAIAAQKERGANERTHFWAKINARNKAKMLDAKFRASVDGLQKTTDGRLRTTDDNYWTVERPKSAEEIAAEEAAAAAEKAKKAAEAEAAKQLELELAARDADEDDDDDMGPPTSRPAEEESTLADAHASINFNDLKIDLPSSGTAGADAARRAASSNPSGKKRISLAEYKRRKAAA